MREWFVRPISPIELYQWLVDRLKSSLLRGKQPPTVEHNGVRYVVRLDHEASDRKRSYFVRVFLRDMKANDELDLVRWWIREFTTADLSEIETECSDNTGLAQETYRKTQAALERKWPAKESRTHEQMQAARRAQQNMHDASSTEVRPQDKHERKYGKPIDALEPVFTTFTRDYFGVQGNRRPPFHGVTCDEVFGQRVIHAGGFRHLIVVEAWRLGDAEMGLQAWPMHWEEPEFNAVIGKALPALLNCLDKWLGPNLLDAGTVEAIVEPEALMHLGNGAKPGRPREKDDVWAWEQIRAGNDKREVWRQWSERPRVKERPSNDWETFKAAMRRAEKRERQNATKG